MFGMGMSEMLIICAVALLVFGPQQLPEMAKKIAKGLKEVRKASDDLKRSINFEDEDERPKWRPPERPVMTETKAPSSLSPPPSIPGSQLANEEGVAHDEAGHVIAAAHAPASDFAEPTIAVAVSAVAVGSKDPDDVNEGLVDDARPPLKEVV